MRLRIFFFSATFKQYPIILPLPLTFDISLPFFVDSSPLIDGNYFAVCQSVCPFSPGLTIGRGGILRVPIERAHRAELANHTAGRGQCVFWELWVWGFE